MRQIRVRKEELLEKLAQNREDHRAIFEEALNGFRQRAIEELDSRLQDLRNGLNRDVRISMPAPTDHTRDYDRAIAMVNMSVDDTIDLDESDFACYVQDDWGWQRQFLSNVYGSTRAVGKFGDVYAVS